MIIQHLRIQNLVLFSPFVFHFLLEMMELIVEFFLGSHLALRGAATLKARALKEVWNIAAVIPVDKGGGNGSNGSSNGSFSGELVTEDNFLGICSRELLARGCELLKRTRKGNFH